MTRSTNIFLPRRSFWAVFQFDIIIEACSQQTIMAKRKQGESSSNRADGGDADSGSDEVCVSFFQEAKLIVGRRWKCSTWISSGLIHSLKSTSSD